MCCFGAFFVFGNIPHPPGAQYTLIQVCFVCQEYPPSLTLPPPSQHHPSPSRHMKHAHMGVFPMSGGSLCFLLPSNTKTVPFWCAFCVWHHPSPPRHMKHAHMVMFHVPGFPPLPLSPFKHEKCTGNSAFLMFNPFCFAKHLKRAMFGGFGAYPLPLSMSYSENVPILAH